MRGSSPAHHAEDPMPSTAEHHLKGKTETSEASADVWLSIQHLRRPISPHMAIRAVWAVDLDSD